MQQRKTMKNVSKNKFLTCFRPEVVDVDAMPESKPSVDGSTSRRFSCIPVAAKHEKKKNSETKTMFLEQGCQKSTENNWAVPQTTPKRRLVKVIEAILLKTIMNRRAHHKNRYSQDCFGSKRSYNSDEYTESGDVKVKSMKVYMDSNIKEIKATELSMSSSSSSSPVSESKKDQLEKQNKFKCFGIYMVLISLAVTVLWGKYYGVILTPIWLCFFSLWKASHDKPKEGAKLKSTTSKGHKNRDHNGRTGRKELS